MLLAGHREYISQSRLHVLNIDSRSVRKTHQFPASHDFEFNIRKVPVGDVRDRFEKEREIFEHRLPVGIPQPFFVEKCERKSFRSDRIRPLLSEAREPARANQSEQKQKFLHNPGSLSRGHDTEKEKALCSVNNFKPVN
jgi:hypothetical protein